MKLTKEEFASKIAEMLENAKSNYVLDSSQKDVLILQFKENPDHYPMFVITTSGEVWMEVPHLELSGKELVDYRDVMLSEVVDLVDALIPRDDQFVSKRV
jgi:hypothetical protein